MKYLTNTLLAIVTIAVVLGIWECAGSPYLGLGVRTPFESAAGYGLIEVADDWSYLDQWIVEAQLPEREEWKNGFSADRLNRVVNDRLEKLGAPRLLLVKSSWDWRVNPDFVTWWHDNSSHVSAASPESHRSTWKGTELKQR